MIFFVSDYRAPLLVAIGPTLMLEYASPSRLRNLQHPETACKLTYRKIS